MKKLNKILLILSLVLCLGGGLLIGIRALLPAASTRPRRSRVRACSITTRIKRSSTNCLLSTRSSRSAIWKSAPSDDEHAYLEYHIEGTREKAPLHVSVENGVLQLRDENYNHFSLKR